MKTVKKTIWTILAGVLCLVATACTPGVQIHAPEKPIEINMNVKVQQDVHVKVSDADREKLGDNLSVLGLPKETKN